MSEIYKNKKIEKVPQNLPTKAEIQAAQSDALHLDLGFSLWQDTVNTTTMYGADSSKLLNGYKQANLLKNEIIDIAMQKDLSITDAVLEIYKEKSQLLQGDDLNQFYADFMNHVSVLVYHLYDSKHRTYLKLTPDLPLDVLTEISHDQLRLALKKLQELYKQEVVAETVSNHFEAPLKTNSNSVPENRTLN